MNGLGVLHAFLKKSKNIPLIRKVQEVGFSVIEKHLDQFVPRLKKPLKEYPAQILGAIELSLTEVTHAFSKFIKSECSMVESGEIEFEDTVLNILSNAGETTLENFAKPFMKDSRFFGKTGTSNYAHDNWFVGFDGKNIMTVWFGLEGERTPKSLMVSGSSTSYRIYEQFHLRSGLTFQSIDCPVF